MSRYIPEESHYDYGDELNEGPEDINLALPGQIKSNIRKALDGIQSSGDFAYFESVEDSVNPGLHISDLGLIGLPPSNRDLAAIVDVCHRSPFGKGTETLVDTSVRKC